MVHSHIMTPACKQFACLSGRFASLSGHFGPLCGCLVDFPTRNVNGHFMQRSWYLQANFHLNLVTGGFQGGRGPVVTLLPCIELQFFEIVQQLDNPEEHRWFWFKKKKKKKVKERSTVTQCQKSFHPRRVEAKLGALTLTSESEGHCGPAPTVNIMWSCSTGINCSELYL